MAERTFSLPIQTITQAKNPAMTPKTITLPADLYERVQQEAQGEGKTVDEVATEAVKRELLLKFGAGTLDKTGVVVTLQRSGDLNLGNRGAAEERRQKATARSYARD